MRTRCISGCRGLSSYKLRSPFLTADGTFKAAVRPLVSHDDPSDWSAVGAGTECQPSGSDTNSSISVVRSTGSSKASSLKSVGAVSGSTWTSTSRAPRAPQSWRCRQWDSPCCASVRRCTFRRCHQALYPRRACGRSAKRASAKDPVVETQQYFFDLTSADIGV